MKYSQLQLELKLCYNLQLHQQKIISFHHFERYMKELQKRKIEKGIKFTKDCEHSVHYFEQWQTRSIYSWLSSDWVCNHTYSLTFYINFIVWTHFEENFGAIKRPCITCAEESFELALQCSGITCSDRCSAVKIGSLWKD